MFKSFESDKPYFCVINSNGYKCFVNKEYDNEGELLKTTIEFVYLIEEINYLIGVYELESTPLKKTTFSVGKLKFADMLIASKQEQYSSINNYLPILHECTKVLSDCWFRTVCLQNNVEIK